MAMNSDCPIYSTQGSKKSFLLIRDEQIFCCSGAPVVRMLDSTIPWINLYTDVNAIGFADSYLLHSDLSSGQSYSMFEQQCLVLGNLLTCPMSKAQVSHQNNILNLENGEGQVKDKLKFKCFFKALSIVTAIIIGVWRLLYGHQDCCIQIKFSDSTDCQSIGSACKESSV